MDIFHRRTGARDNDRRAQAMNSRRSIGSDLPSARAMIAAAIAMEFTKFGRLSVPASLATQTAATAGGILLLRKVLILC
jgi:hypothetical protein